MNQFERKPVDVEFYQRKIREFLPRRLIDIHAHVWLKKFESATADTLKRAVSWPSLVAKENSIEDLLSTYRLLFPGINVTPLIFSNIGREDDFEAANRYTSACAQTGKCHALVFARPQWSAKEFEAEIIRGKFLGAKVYLTLSPEHLLEKEITIYDFLPRHQLEVLDHHGWIVILHIPRPERLKDPVNIAQLLEIGKSFPRIKLVVAHVGRAYCESDIGDALDLLRPAETLLFDISANTNTAVFEQLIRAVGPKRILFGSDLPIVRMRMRRIEKSGRYVNLVPKGLYGNVSNDPNMGEVEGAEAERLTFFLYEEVAAFAKAAKHTGLSRQDIEDVFYNNAIKIIEGARTSANPGSADEKPGA